MRTTSRAETKTRIDAKTIAGLYLDLKGAKKKRRDWISIAEDCAKVVDASSVAEVADKIGVSSQLIRSLVSLTELPDEIKAMVKRGDILFDSAYRLNTIEDKEKQLEVATMIVGLDNHQQRQLIFQAKKFPDSDLADFRRRLSAEPIRRKMHIVIIPLEEETYEKVEAISKRLGRPKERLLSDAIANWANRG